MSAVDLGRVFIMCWNLQLVEAGTFNDETLETLSNCRKFLQVTTLADIANANGTHITLQAWQGRRLQRHHTPPLNWGKALRPSQNDWDKWRSALKLFLNPMSRDRKLSLPLGAWLEPTDEHWMWWKLEATDRIYQALAKDHWIEWLPFGRHYQPSSNIILDAPSSLTRIDVDLSRSGQHLTVASKDENAPITTPAPETPPNVYALLDALPDNLQWAIYRCTIPAGGLPIADAIRAGDSVTVADASLKDQFGTASFILEGADEIGRIPGVNVVPGPLQDGDSYRCELAGLIGAMVIVLTLCESHSITQGGMTVACDNISTLRIFNPNFVPEPSAESFDLVCCLHSLVLKIPIVLQAVHVRGHALKRKKAWQLSRLEA